MKKGILTFLVLLSIALPVVAADEKVWFTPMPGKETSVVAPGDPILVYAKLSNTTSNPITYVVAFIAGEKTIGSKVVTVSGYSGQDISIEWKMPESSTEVIATIARATDKNKKEIKALVAPIGVVVVSNAPPKSDLTFGSIKGWAGKVIDTLEAYRVRELDFFTRLKMEANVVLSRTTLKDVNNLLQPETKTQSVTDASPQVEQKDNGTTVGYAKLIYATVGRAFFANKAVYFVIGILVVLLGIRLILKLLFR